MTVCLKVRHRKDEMRRLNAARLGVLVWYDEIYKKRGVEAGENNLKRCHEEVLS
jgi:hypothetical protein